MQRRSKKASVVLVALSCVTVLGIAMASFLAVTNQAMRLSNRDYAKVVSKQLAEIGLEQALRAYNSNSFGAGWTLVGSTATASLTTTASGSLPGLPTFVSGGVTRIIPVVKIRVERYLAAKKATPWSVLTTYAVNDFVWYQGVWYRCKAATTNQDPSDTTYWTAAPQVWGPYVNYKIGNIVLWGGSAYRCIADNINNAIYGAAAPPPNATYWTSFTPTTWNVASVYAVGDVVSSGGMLYLCVSGHFGNGPPNTTYWLSGPVIYAEGIATLPDSNSTTIKTQLRATVAPASLFPNAAGSVTYTNLSSTGAVDSYNSVIERVATPTTTIGSSAVVAGGNTSSTAVNITNVRVRGYVAAPPGSTAPFNPQYSSSTSGIVTSTASGTPPSKIDLTRVSRSPNIPQFDIQTVAPATNNNLSPFSGTVTLPRVGDTVNAADGKYYYYTNGDLSLSSNSDGSSPDILSINGPVVIDIRSGGASGGASDRDFYIQAAGRIVILNVPTASLELHLGGRLYIGSNTNDTTYNVGGGILNQTFDPKRCIILSTSTYNSSGWHYFWSKLPYYGVIYMPKGYLHMWNSGAAYIVGTYGVYGALSAANIYFNHPTYLHYDTSLRTATFGGVDSPYQIAEWRELTDPTERVTL